MDAAPLTTAHELARDALVNTPQSASTASEKHKAAASEFAKATDGVNDSEALRVLNLLEQHHQRLAQIISSTSDRSRPDAKREVVAELAVESPVRSHGASTPPPSSTSKVPDIPGPKQSQAFVQQRRQGRDMSSSIASNLASARGIPGSSNRRGPTSHLTPLTESILQQQSRQSQRDVSRGESQSDCRAGGRKESSSEDGDKLPIDASQGRGAVDSSQSEASFQKFYNTFEGLLGKLSAPLAFAGLPLVPEENETTSRPVVASTPKLAPETTTHATSPDISKIFSKAALRAVKDDHGSLGVQESFFVVPTAGGTVSYAGVLSRAERQALNRGQTLETPLEERISDDNAETMPEVGGQRSSKAVSKIPDEGSRKSTKTTEELEIENESLKQLTDNLSRRLYMWEKSAQSQSMALQQSIRSLQPPPRSVRDHLGAAHGPDQEKEMREMEEQLTLAQKEVERYGRENEKLTAVVLRYRQRWEKLKEGARVRREGALKGADAQQNTEDSTGGVDAS